MKFSLETSTDAYQIHSYDDNQVIINPEKQSYPLRLGESLIITPREIITDTKIGEIKNISDQQLSYLQNLEPEILIFTEGSSVHYPQSKTVAELAKKSIGVECMALGAACRTYNLLVLEDRRVVLVISLI